MNHFARPCLHRLAALLVAAATFALAPNSASAQCDPSLVPPDTLRLGANDQILFFGDSISRRFGKPKIRPAHYARTFQRILTDTYCDCADIVVSSTGRIGHNYRTYQRRIKRRLSRKNAPEYDWVIVQDAGRAVRNDFLAPGVAGTIAGAREALPNANVVLATTPPLDRPRASRGALRRYTDAEDFGPFNDTVEQIAATMGAEVMPWSVDACSCYSRDPGFDATKPDFNFRWTFDGIHPLPHGELVMALSALKHFGVPREHLNLTNLWKVDDAFNLTTVETIADWVYSAADWAVVPPAPCPLD